jgi:hypothetical protein
MVCAGVVIIQRLGSAPITEQAVHRKLTEIRADDEAGRFQCSILGKCVFTLQSEELAELCYVIHAHSLRAVRHIEVEAVQPEYLIMAVRVDNMFLCAQSMQHRRVRCPLCRIQIKIGIQTVERRKLRDHAHESLLASVCKYDGRQIRNRNIWRHPRHLTRLTIRS